VPHFTSDKSGVIDDSRNWVIAGRERHVSTARPGNLPYPQRCLRTKDFLYIRNFEPDRWPLGEPRNVTETSAPLEELERSTYAGFADMDASPAKAWLISQRNNPEWKWHYDYAFAKRPAEELYDLKTDPGQLKNVAAEAAYSTQRAELEKQLMDELRRVEDPRVIAPDTFEKAPYVDPKEEPRNEKMNRKGKGKGKAK
jgi:N-sulfoglucosamine sulfohydrolase